MSILDMRIEDANDHVGVLRELLEDCQEQLQLDPHDVIMLGNALSGIEAVAAFLEVARGDDNEI
jgi:hypothetical protein